VLTAESLSFAYRDRVRVVDGVSLAVARGDVVGILGPNGSGKTTLLKLLAGTLAPATGHVTLDGRPLSTWTRREVARRVAFVPQDTHTPFDFTVLDIVLMGRFPHLGVFTLEGPADLAVARQALAATNTAAFEARPFSTLSGGERQRVVIAGALAQSPELLLLDEPTASLDLGHQMDVQALLARLNAEHGATLVLTTHDLGFAAGLCRSLVLLKDGRVLAAGPTNTVLTRAHVRALYDVDADVAYHQGARRVTVTPIARTEDLGS
jgi:iron complex transport system ATP-binding protein